MTRSKIARNSTTLTIDDGPTQDDPNTPSVAMEIIKRQRQEQACCAATARNASGKRQLVDPTTNEEDNSEAEMELMWAMQRYKQTSGRMFPTWSEVLEVLKSLGYERVGPDGG